MTITILIFVPIIAKQTWRSSLTEKILTKHVKTWFAFDLARKARITSLALASLRDRVVVMKDLMESLAGSTILTCERAFKKVRRGDSMKG